MFDKITPEQAGISSKIISDFIEMLEDRGAATHGILFIKDGKIFAEGYWQPFHRDFCHRMYSQTKSFGGVATNDGFMYDDAVSFTWLDENKCMLFVQIIDRYFANMNAIFAFNGDDVVVCFTKTAEAFLEEYEGILMAHKK